jgi:hypothetical protein
LITGNAYAADYTAPTPADLITAVNKMDAAYSDAAGRPTPNGTDLGSGEIGGLIIVPGLYKWNTAVTITTSVTLSGGPNDVWIFQIDGALTLSASMSVNLSGGALAKNIFWETVGAVSINANSQFEGVVLSGGAITTDAGSTVKGRLLSQTAVTITGNGHVTQPLP